MNGFPLATTGQKIGLFGGSFDPPHEGHLLVAEQAVRRLNLDQLWWIPSPGNPLKSWKPASIEDRINAIQAMITDPKMNAYDIETQLQTVLTIDTVRGLKRHYSGVNFVLVCGADLLIELNDWEGGDALISTIPICAFARPGKQTAALASPFAKKYAQYRVNEDNVASLSKKTAPAWTLVHGQMSNASSTAIRASRSS